MFNLLKDQKKQKQKNKKNKKEQEKEKEKDEAQNFGVYSMNQFWRVKKSKIKNEKSKADTSLGLI